MLRFSGKSGMERSGRRMGDWWFMCTLCDNTAAVILLYRQVISSAPSNAPLSIESHFVGVHGPYEHCVSVQFYMSDVFNNPNFIRIT